jgi:hypothetical protein
MNRLSAAHLMVRVDLRFADASIRPQPFCSTGRTDPRRSVARQRSWRYGTAVSPAVVMLGAAVLLWPCLAWPGTSVSLACAAVAAMAALLDRSACKCSSPSLSYLFFLLACQWIPWHPWCGAAAYVASVRAAPAPVCVCCCVLLLLFLCAYGCCCS